jgi:hypothetical protein
VGCVTPDSDLYAAARIISYCDANTVLALTIFHLDLRDGTDLKYYANNVDCRILGKHFQALDQSERKTIIQDFCIFTALFNLSLLVKSETKVIFDACKSLVCHLDLSIGKNVNFFLLDFAVPLVSRLIEHRGLDHGAFPVNQVDIHNFPFAFRISVLTKWGLLDDTGLQTPISRKLVEGFDRHILISIIDLIVHV